MNFLELVMSIPSFENAVINSHVGYAPEPPFKKSKIFYPTKRSYTCTPLLDNIDCLVSTKSIKQIEKQGEFRDLEAIVGRVNKLDFDILNEGHLEFLEAQKCKLFFLNNKKSY
jgi:hypothetical protein